jgi:predicted ATPase
VSIAATSLQVGARTCACPPPTGPPRLIAVTGGPGAGKTAVLELARLQLCQHVAVLPEAAGVLFGGGFPRMADHPSRRCAQRAMFHVQRQLERLAIEQGTFHAVLCDRGTLDGIAYWPGTAEAWCTDLGTTLADERGRYSAVIHLRPPGDAQGYNHDNHLRTESSDEAGRIDDRILAAWEGHAKLGRVDRSDDFVEKTSRALALLHRALPEECRPPTG